MIVFLVLVLWPPSDLANKCQRDSFLSSSSSLLTLPANKDPAFRRNKFPGGNFSQISGWTISLIPAYRQPPLSTPLIPFQRKQSASRSYLTSYVCICGNLINPKEFSAKVARCFFSEGVKLWIFLIYFSVLRKLPNYLVNNALFLIWKINLHCRSEKLKTQTILFSPFDKKASQKSILALVEAIKSPKRPKKR